MRVLGAVDAKAMAAIHAQSFERGWPALDMATHTQSDLCLGVDAGTDLAGFIILRTQSDEAEILTLAVALQARGQGVGRRLLSGCETRLMADGVTDLFLEVAEDNVAARALYAAAGFTPMGRRPGYYRRAGGRMAALTFRKKLDAPPPSS